MSLSTAKLPIDDVKSDGTFPSRQYIKESVNLSSVSADLFRIDKSIGVAVRTDLLSKYSLKGSVKDLAFWSAKSVISWDILNFGNKSAPQRVTLRSSLRLGRSWLMTKRVFSERSGLTSTELERASNAFVLGSDAHAELFDLLIKVDRIR